RAASSRLCSNRTWSVSDCVMGRLRIAVAEAQRALGEETLWRAGGEGYVVGRRRKGILVPQRVNVRRADSRDSRILLCGKSDVCNGAPAVAGAIAAFGGSAVMASVSAMPRHALI